MNTAPTLRRNPVAHIFCDGACSGNPGPGGWGALVRWSGRELHRWGGTKERTTNNRMELLAALEGLRALPHPMPTRVTSDSQYLVKGMNEWLNGWKHRGWKTSMGKAVDNTDLWKLLDIESKRFLDAGCLIEWAWVKGHSGHEDNEAADKMAAWGLAGRPCPGADRSTQTAPDKPPIRAFLEELSALLQKYEATVLVGANGPAVNVGADAADLKQSAAGGPLNTLTPIY